MNEKTIKVLGLVTTVAGAVCTVLSTLVDNKQQDIKIEKAVEKYMSNK